MQVRPHVFLGGQGGAGAGVTIQCRARLRLRLYIRARGCLRRDETDHTLAYGGQEPCFLYGLLLRWQ